MRFNSKGFTLIEMVIVIGVIGILSGGALMILRPDTQLKNSRDQQRKSEMKRLAAAAEQFRADVGRYPQTGTFSVPTATVGVVNSAIFNISGVAGRATAIYISPVPAGPNLGGNQCNGYLYASNGDRYTIFVKLENANDPDALAVKTAPSYVPTGGTSVNGYRGFSWSSGTCANNTFNYWISNP